jgi:hypothetical protein
VSRAIVSASPNWYRAVVAKWIAEYVVEVEDGEPRVTRVTVHRASRHYNQVGLLGLDDREWRVFDSVGLIGQPQGTGDIVVYQNLGESPTLTARQSRRIKPDHALRLVRERLRELRGSPSWATTLLRDEWRSLLEQPASREGVLAATAARYVAALEAGDRHPVTSVAADLGLRQSQVRDRIYKARRDGLLEPTDKARGRPRGRLSARAIELLGKESPA